MRFVRVLVALVFGLAMAGPETHACPVHSAAPPLGSHHQQSGDHQQTAHCTCPQACCPSAVSAHALASSVTWTVPALPQRFADADSPVSFYVVAIEHAHPFALGPPHSLA
jgi:hypothetical protein